MPISPYHPVEDFLFCVEGNAPEELVEPMKNLVEELARSREWVLGPPEFVDETEELDDTAHPDDEPIRTVGGIIRLYSTLPPTFLEVETDQLHFEEVNCIISAAKKFTLTHQVGIEMILNGETIGFVEEGEVDEELEDGTLKPWKESLDNKR